MRILKPSLIGLTTAAMLSNPLMFINVAKADVPPFLFDTHKTRLPHADCIRDARRTAREVGFTDVKDLDFALLANVGNSVVLIVCTFIPAGGPCPGQDGAVVTTVSSGQDVADTFRRVQSSFGNGTLIDCG